ncbi:MAG TPA: hypothetical protein HPP77_06175 [Candidatus Hydrogenedentes bacterium]|nr:hypothetical protein [Candidatus Hydrogenedentota bacterium]HIJ73215.1 hypothetical protein [Candidatus Hydrogenedentota bacterium]
MGKMSLCVFALTAVCLVLASAGAMVLHRSGGNGTVLSEDEMGVVCLGLDQGPNYKCMTTDNVCRVDGTGIFKDCQVEPPWTICAWLSCTGGYHQECQPLSDWFCAYNVPFPYCCISYPVRCQNGTCSYLDLYSGWKTGTRITC